MKHFMLSFALSAAFYTCFEASCAFAQSAPEAQQTENDKDSRQSNISVITINSNSEAAVLIDNKRIGNTPIAIAIEPGKHEFELISADATLRIKKHLEAKAGEQASFSFDFSKGLTHAVSTVPADKLAEAKSELNKRLNSRKRKANIKNKRSKDAAYEQANAEYLRHLAEHHIELPF